MIKISIPSDNIEERKYIIDILFNEFLGLEYVIEVKSGNNGYRENSCKCYKIALDNGNKLIIEDHFFSKFPTDLEYLNEKNIPKKVEFGTNDFIVEDDIPIIFGNSKFKIQNSKFKIIECGIDIFASSFFMLTRWEEYVNQIRDNHLRFPGVESTAYKNNFLHRPVVNEYTEFLWNLLKFLELNVVRGKKKFKLLLTHDIDVIYKYKNFKSLLKRINNTDFFTKLKIFFNFEKDPYDTFDYLMDISEKLNIKSYFFLHSSDNSPYDFKNEKKYLKDLSQKIQRRGHFIGFHPSYNSYNNNKLFLKEKKYIEKIINFKLKFGRQHYLRFEVPVTWQIWENSNMEWDSTAGYADIEGFRCGVCYPFSVFNILTRKKLNLKEKPLILMDSTLFHYQSISKEKEIKEKIKKLIKKVKKYNGEFVLLWHNTSFEKISFELYEKILTENVYET